MSLSSHTTHRFENPAGLDFDRMLLGEAGALLADGSNDAGEGHASDNDPELTP